MGREVKKPKEELAPSYFMQYSGLWCILLGFFVMLLSLGSTQMGPGADGLGQVRDAFGTTGGLGLLPFAKNAMFGNKANSGSSFRIRKATPKQSGNVDSYIQGMLWKKGISDVSMIRVVHSKSHSSVVLRIPLEFRSDNHLMKESTLLLNLLSEVLLSLHEYDMEIMAWAGDGETEQENRRSAMVRSAVVTRYLMDVASLSPLHIQAVGFSDTLLKERYGIEPVKGEVMISIQENRDT